jgi:hypothetical protein
LAALTGLGLDVLVPFGSGQPFDLALYLGNGGFLRVQCKRGWQRGGCLIFNCRSTDHGRGPGSYVGLADLFGVFFPPTRTVYLVPIEEIARSEGRLRLEPTCNNQRRGIRMAADFEIDRWTAERLLALVP